MRKTAIGLLFFTVVLTACSNFERLNANVRNDCGGMGRAGATVHYRDSEISVTPPITNLTPGGEFQIRLAPKGNGPNLPYGMINVTVVGVGADAAWIHSKTQRCENMGGCVMGMDAWCVPDDAERDTYYKYSVTVEDVGVLDPRVHVN